MNAVMRWSCLTKVSVPTAARRVVLAVSTSLLGMLALAAPASAFTETFGYSGGPQTWNVPRGITEATFDLYGGAGGGFAADPSLVRASAVRPRRRSRSPLAPRSR